ncbi:MAG TPA: hypothetical protein PLZ02_01245 [Candidatus Woesebacteria bacterium]|nr:hypothetical protein [Candidatus Woesebacteria bacterium]
MKKTLVVFLGIILLLGGAWFLFGKEQQNQLSSEEIVLQETYALSREYLNLRYKTENVLEKAEEFANYDAWNKEMDSVIGSWEDFEKRVDELEKMASKMSEENVGFNIITPVFAYDKHEISEIVDGAPVGKKIATLANFLGVDAKHAQLILNQSQDEISREAFGEEGDVFEKCEQNSLRIKNGCKITGYVGGVVLTGGTSAVVASGALATTTTVVVGADLVLEVTDDEAKIALGDKNKVSEMVSSIRTVTEPTAAILTISNIPGNLSKGIDKLSVLSFGADQLRSVIQDEKVLGISIKVNEAGELKSATSALTEEELVEWRKDNQAPKSQESFEEIIVNAENVASNLAVEEEENLTTEDSNEQDTTNIAGSGWEGTLSSMSGGDNEKRTLDFDFILNKDGSVNGGSFKKWEQAGDRIKLYAEDKSTDYYEFKVSENGLLLTKIVIGDEVIQPGQKYMGGIAPAGYLAKKTSSTKEGSQSNPEAMPISEYNELDDKGLLDNISNVTKNLGEPDVKTTDDNGYIIYIYYDLVKYDNGNLGSVKMAFYNEEAYQSYIEGVGASWESGKEIWDKSGGGIRANSQIKPADTFKQIYGE